MARRDDIVTIVIDAKNEIKKSIDGLDGRVNDLERSLRADLVHEVEGMRKALEDMKTSQAAAQKSASRAESRAGEAVAAVAELRSEVLRLHEHFDGLRGGIGQILDALSAGAPRLAPAADAGTEPGLTPSSAQGQAPRAETEPVPDAQTMAEAPAETAAAEGVSMAAEDDLAPDGEDEDASDVQATWTAQEADEEDRDPSTVALEATESTDDQKREPEPFSSRGRIFAISRAARVASATLVCHRDTWEFVATQAGSHPHFRPPALEDRENGLVAAVLSGRSLVAMLLALYQVEKTSVRHPDTGDVNEMTAYADWIMATKVYTETANVLRNAYSTDGDPVVITIDNRLPARS